MYSLLAFAPLAGCATKTFLPPPPPATTPASPTPTETNDWTSLFNGRDLTGWQITDFSGHGPVTVQDGALVLGAGSPMTGVNRTAPPALLDYEVSLEARRLDGADFFCALTFPVGTNHCSLIVGGWGGELVGLSSLDGYDASENETASFRTFQTGTWYRIRLRVTAKRLQAWIDAKQVVDVVIWERSVKVRPGDIELSQPFGLATYSTGAAFRDLRCRPLAEDEVGRR